jgi:hypothetical protein
MTGKVCSTGNYRSEDECQPRRGETSAARQTKDDDLIAAGRAVLKAEWEKVKAEMRGGAFQTGN